MTPDLHETANAASEREYVVRANYAEAITEAGGIPLILPYESGGISAALTIADGILITGARPGAEVTTHRSEFEKALVRQALDVGKPLLGICHGMQLIGECLGGTFVTDLPEMADSRTAHMPHDIPDRLAHEIAVEPGSSFAGWLGDAKLSVNSLHRHALTGSGQFRVVARASDGVIEAFEGETIGFSLGVQWHPEYRLTAFDRYVLKTFVDRAASALKSAAEEFSRGSSVYDRLSDLGLTLPEASVPPGSFVGAVRSGRVVTVSGQVPLKDGSVVQTGHLGDDVSIEEGQDCARWALLNALAQLERIAGGLERVSGFVRLAGYVAARPDFTRHGAVVDGASELLRGLFPDRWAHARIAVGVSSLPRGVPVEIELTAILTDED
ncbi:Atu1372/SO_1960 family protein [Rhizobium herbae]|uniref:Gamma-glutamyl-gamma-aminobutyrate hydrolase PuuD/enamine deaminase RidA (YjgF/YER057c/UK114 family) n=1 Tax=Rhizobium herbae TaxID=508661 RepID=A0ABS4EUP1_9HYPH|nr:Atu1372/SO_1960 family protein [Rhizobium herbae]MBP1861657.1 gamma-glutamyl-gamma-aminobutyrate hydrolase PuuD/enamine deaminase RidA (YjgF/YER057c/UK114 family) [Rhizobium herbae]